MAHPKLFTLVDAIDLKQVNTLRKYILSKVSEQSEAYQILETIIKTKDKREKYHDAESMQLAFYPKIKIKTFINYLSLLYSYAEDWIALAQMEIDEHSKDLLVQKWLNSNALYSLSDQLVKKVLKKIETSEGLDINDAKVKAELFYEHLFNNNPIKLEFYDIEYLEMLNAFDEFICSYLLIFNIELKNICLKNKKTYDNETRNITPKLNYIPDAPITNFLKLNLDVLFDDNFENFSMLKDYLLEHKIRKGTKFHSIIANYIIKKSTLFRSKGIDNTKMIFELTKYGLDTGTFISNGKLSITTFHNLVVRLSIHSSYEEIEKFILDWLPKVNTINKDTTFSIAMAQNCFYHQKFNDIFQYAWVSEIEDFNQKLISQDLLLVHAFMNRNTDMNKYKSTFKATVGFLERNKLKLPIEQKKRYDNLLSFLKDIEQQGIQNINLVHYRPIHYTAWCEYLIKNLADK